jgi:hypothetical protein
MTITRHIKEIGTLAMKYQAEIYFGFVAIHKVSFYETSKLPVRLLSKALHVLILP